MAELGNNKDIKWNTRLESFFCETGEKAICFSWLHKQAETMYSTRTVFIDIPVILLGTINGSISVGSNTLFGDSKMAPVIIGGIILVSALLTTVSSYFAWARRAEAHKISANSWSKLYRFLSVEMSLPRHERMTPTDILKYVRNEYDRLTEISPLIPKVIIDRFRQKFSTIKDIAFPEETNGLHPIIPYKEKTPTTPQDEQKHPVIEIVGFDEQQPKAQ